jgi:very-short-patch-repair endonuclease
LVEDQHGVVARRQLIALGLASKMIDRRIASSRLHPLWRSVYAVGRPTVNIRGWWMAAVLACGDGAVLSHESAAFLWGIRRMRVSSESRRARPSLIHVSVPADRSRRLNGIRAHRRRELDAAERTRHDGIPVTAPVRTLIDLATLLPPAQLEAAVNSADKLDLVDPEHLRQRVDERCGMDGVKGLRRVLDRRTFALTDSELERRFLRLVRRAKLPPPRTQQRVNGFRVDFLWPEFRLIVETDGLRYHRTPSQQAKDRIRDQALVATGFIVLRFTHAQVVYDPNHVVETLRAVSNPVSLD